MAHLLRLISGPDPRYPTRTLQIANSSSTANIHLRMNGFAPGPGKKKVIYSGESTRFDGEQRVSSSRGNARFNLTYDLNSSSPARIQSLQGEIERFFQDAGLYEEHESGEPVWLEDRWQDGLDDVPAPVLGQFSHYLRILDAEVQDWPKSLHSGALVAGNVEGVAASLVCRPHSEGLEQQLFNAIGQVEVGPLGVMAAPATTNLFTNPSFAHTTFNQGWTASAADLYVAETAGLTYPERGAAHLYNQNSAVRNFTQTMTLSATTHVLSFVAKKPDLSAVTSSDVVVWGAGSARTTTFISLGDNKYLCYAAFTASAGSSTYGVEVKGRRDVIVSDFNLHANNTSFTSYPVAFGAGHIPGCTWSGTAHDSTSTRSATTYKRVLADELSGEFVMMFWAVPLWGATDISGNATLMTYVIASDNFGLSFLDAGNVWSFTGSVGGTSPSISSGAQTHTYGTPVHFAIHQDISAANYKLYINGALAGTSSAIAPIINGGGTLYLGNSNGGTQPFNGWIDGLRVFKYGLSATQIAAFYTAELAVKTAATKALGGFPYLWTKDGDGVLDAVDDTGRDNFCIIGGISGDVEGLTEWRIQPPTSTPPRCFWLGRKAVSSGFEAALLWLEHQGVADAGTSGGEYFTATSSGNMTLIDTITTADMENFRGRYRYIGHFYVTTNNVTVKPAFHWNAASETSATFGDTVTVATNALMLLRDFGELNIFYNDNRLKPTSIVVYLSVTPVTGTSTIRLDFIQLLPYPNARIQATDASISISAGDLLIISGTEAYIHRSSDNAFRYDCEYRGDPVDVLPNKYNYIFFLPGEEGTAYDIADTGTFTVYVTPRWLLPGGAIA